MIPLVAAATSWSSLHEHLPQPGQHPASGAAPAKSSPRDRSSAPSGRGSSAASGSAAASRQASPRRDREDRERDRPRPRTAPRAWPGALRVGPRDRLEEVEDRTRGRRARAWPGPPPPSPRRPRAPSPRRGASASRIDPRRARVISAMASRRHLLRPRPQRPRGSRASPPARSGRGVEPLASRHDITGTSALPVVAKINFTCAGGSSSVFRSALKAAGAQHVHLVDDVDLVARGERPVRAPSMRSRMSPTVARGRVHLEDVHMPPLGDRPGRPRKPRTADRRPALSVRPGAVQPLRDDQRHHVLPTPRTRSARRRARVAGPRKQQSVRHGLLPEIRSAKVAGRFRARTG